MSIHGRRSAPMLVAAIVLLLASCRQSITMPDDEDGSMYGVIVALDRPTSSSGDNPTVHVKRNPLEECGVIFTITDDTALAEGDRDDQLHEIEPEDLRVGQSVRVWTDAVMRSCPGQAWANALLVIEE